MSAFRGRYEHQMDEKGRLSLPSAFRRGEGEDRFVLLQWEKPYLTLFPEAKWTEVEARLLEYRKTGAQAMNQVRVLFAGLVEVSPDKQGRILVPAPLQQAAALGGPVLLLGMSDRVELWDPATYDKVVESQTGDFDQFAHRLFG
ncbi:MAG TPA: division/cell wall cluster transcriptional repressor MraZ [Longimicrobiales bacterium]|nr:division/cell wall cluster transcriptional repressor MraZ [Longimicrobiales bacterium]